MRLADFILHDLECILQEWEDFAATLAPSEQRWDKAMLRDHAKKMLEVISADLAEPQTRHEEIKKSKGHNADPGVQITAATIHGKERLASGFSLEAAVAEYRALRASVTRLWQKSLQNKPILDTAIGDLIRFNEAIDQSITESVISYSFEKEQQMRVFDTVLSSLPDISFTFTLDGRFSYVNKALTELFACPSDQLIGKNFTDIGLPNGAELQRQIQQVIYTKKQFRSEMSYTAASGQWGFYDYIFVPVLDKKGLVEAVVGTARNVTERKTKEDQNWYKANYDLLTGLPNRRFFLDRLEQEIRNAARTGVRTALLFIDLDHFKEANDQYGHDVGDLLLRLVTERLRSCIRETDTAARMGGDEFTVILQNLLDTKHIELVAGKILTELRRPFQIGNDTLHISASIGITFSPQDASTPEYLIKNADQAMYMAKKAGRNQFCFFSSV
ncbi:diguanylate cyclase domain-containing protein [Undibacterium sp. Di27W]|uniref:diguanylate cyclase domain-containing protein n=1 Tax=Undibacterium sp. Di27W TaxID=3413036 RepID=UPI003BF08417